MIWAGFSSKGKTDFVILRGKQNSAKYVETLQQRLLPFKARYHPDVCTFQ